MTVVALCRSTLIFHLLMTILAESVADVFPFTEFLIFELSIVAGIALLNFTKCIITTGNPGSSIVHIMMAGSTIIFLLMCCVRELDRFFAVGIQNHLCRSLIAIC